MKSKLQKRIAKALSSIDEDGDYWKWKILPSPIKLGMSDSNALGSRHFGNQPGQPTWDDWEEKVKEMMPVRYFLVEELVPWFKLQWRKYVTDPVYWLKCHFLKSHRYHMLDLRQPANKEFGFPAYKYGWIDSDTKISYALLNILNTFVKDEMPHKYCPSEEEVIAEPHMQHQRSAWLETKAIHYWWNVERLRQQKTHDELLHKWSEAHKVNAPETQQLWDEMKKAEQALEDKEEEMLIRMIKIRRSLWT
jgi:hypothetical protein